MQKRTLSLLCAALMMVSASFTHAAEPEKTEQVIQPQIDRRDVSVPKIDAQDLEIGYFIGKLSVEDFGSEGSSGWRIAYHVTEDFFVEGMRGTSTVSDESFRRLGIPIFTRQSQELEYSYMSVGYNMFPGEVFLGRNFAMTSAVFVIGGIGNVNFNNEDHTAFNFGFGIRVLPWDWCSIRFEFRDHAFESDLLGKNELKHNYEMSLGLSAYF